jgi:hypothetical protein
MGSSSFAQDPAQSLGRVEEDVEGPGGGSGVVLVAILAEQHLQQDDERVRLNVVFK